MMNASHHRGDNLKPRLERVVAAGEDGEGLPMVLIA